MTHEEIQILISAYIDGEVSPSEKNIVEEHLRICKSCQKNFQSYTAITSSLSKWPNETLSPDEEINVQKRLEQRREPMFTKRTLMALGTTLALTIIIGSTVQVYIKRGVPGRLKSAADDIGDQYSQAKTQYAPMYMASSYQNEGGLSATKDDRSDQYSDGNTAVLRKSYNGPMAAAQLATVSAPVMEKESMDESKGESLRSEFGMNNSGAVFQQAAGTSGAFQLNNKTSPQYYQSGYRQFSINSERKIIKNADMTIKVKSAQSTQNDLEELIAKYNGIIINSNINKLDDGTQRGVVVFNVFPQDFDRVMHELRKLGEVISEQQNGNDITNQYTYLQTQLDNNKRIKEQLEKVLKKNMNNVDNNLNIQSQISNVDNTMANLENNMKDLDLQSYMSSITVNFYETVEVVQPKDLSFNEKVSSTFKKSFKNALESSSNIAINSFAGLVIMLAFLFQVLLWGLLFWGIYLIVSRFFKK